MPTADVLSRKGIVPDVMAATGAESAIGSKMAIEQSMRLDPGNVALRRIYFDMLRLFSAGRTGLSFALLPEFGHPLYFRCGSTDLESLAAVCADGIYDIPLRASPSRILDLGAYAGYAAIYLAHRFPNAEVLCAEPMVENFRLLLMNTLPYQQIACRNVAVWRHAAQLSPRVIRGGDAGTQLAEDGPVSSRPITGMSVGDLLRSVNWPSADLIKCDIVGAEASVFADPGVSWLNTLDALIVRPYDSQEFLVSACFDPRVVQRSVHGTRLVFERETPFRALLAAAPVEMPLINLTPPAMPVFVQDVAPVPWGFFVFGANSCQLHPNTPGEASPARAIFPRVLSGHTSLSGSAWHAGEQSLPIRFTVKVEAVDDEVVAEASYDLVEGEVRPFVVEFPAVHGRCRVVLRTEMTPGQIVNANAWARWLDLRLR